MKVWKQYKLDRDQSIASLILSIVLVFIAGILIGNYFGPDVFFRKPLPTLFYYVCGFIIFYQVSPAIITRIMKDK